MKNENKICFSVDTSGLDEANEKCIDLAHKAAVLDKKLQNITKNIERLDEAKFYTVEDVMKMTGYGKATVLKIFNRPDFPCCNSGRRLIVSAYAFWDYFNKPVKEGDFI